MPLFRRREPPAGAPTGAARPARAGLGPGAPAAEEQRQGTYIAPGTRIEGKLAGSAELWIDGEVHGEVLADAGVAVGRTGVVVGPLTAPVVRIEGRLTGDVRAAESVEVAVSGNLEGDIAAPRVLIAEGAFFKGRVEMKSQQVAAAVESRGAG
jgi:cytoskeletal protein CcmA (bactofilin family)